MKKVELKKIKIDHFRGQNLEITFDGDTNISGRNKAGKSTIYNAFLWVMTGCDMEDRTNFQLFDNRFELTYENSIPVQVDVVLCVDGYDYKFTRIAQQSWSRKRGESEYTKNQSDTYKFLIDDIELSAGEFKKRIEDMFAPADCLKVILNIKQMFSLDWKEQRQLFSHICQEITKDDFKGEYKELYEQMERYSIEEIESRIKTNITPIKNELKSLPLTIETLVSNLPDVSKADEAMTNIEEHKKQIEDINKRLQGDLDSIQPYIDKRTAELSAISDLESQMAIEENKYDRDYFVKKSEIEYQISAVQKRNDGIKGRREHKEFEIKSINTEIGISEERIEQLGDYRLRLKNKLAEVRSRVFADENCAYCGQPLPNDKLEELRNKFLEKRKEEENAIIKEGRANNEKIEAEKESVKLLKDRLKKYEADGDGDEEFADISDLQAKLKDLEENFIPFHETEKGKEMNDKIQSFKNAITVIPQTDNSALISMRTELIHQIEAESRYIGLVGERERQEKKIEEYRARQRTIANELASWELLDKQLKEYKQEKAELVSERVNTQLERCKVEMMTQNKAGDWIPSCTITTEKTQSTVYNKAEKILSGIDISNAFMKHFGLNMPLFIDDAESISGNNKIESDRQIIRLMVSDCDLTVNKA